MHIISTRRENNLGCKNANQTKRGQNEKQNINTRTCEPIWCIQRKHRKNGGPITKPACRNCVQSCTRTGVARCGFDWRRWWIGARFGGHIKRGGIEMKKREEVTANATYPKFNALNREDKATILTLIAHLKGGQCIHRPSVDSPPTVRHSAI